MVKNMLLRSSQRMYIRIPVNVCPRNTRLTCDSTRYQAISRQDTRFRDSSRTDLKTVPPPPPPTHTHTFEDSSATLLIWFSPIFMIEKLGKLEIFKLSNTSVLWFDYLYLVIKIILTLTYLSSHG